MYTKGRGYQGKYIHTLYIFIVDVVAILLYVYAILLYVYAVLLYIHTCTHTPKKNI